MTENKPHYGDAQVYPYTGKDAYTNTYGEQVPPPVNYPYVDTDEFYCEEESSAAGSFLLGALVGGVIGAAITLFLAPKSGREMRSDLNEQAVQWKNRGIELSTVAKDKATELTTAAKVKTDELTKSIQEQSEQLVQKVKTMKSKQTAPLDDGTVSAEGEEAIGFDEQIATSDQTKKDDLAELNQLDHERANMNQNHLSNDQ